MASQRPVRDVDRNCPRCGRVFDATTDVCPDDGAPLVDHTIRSKPKDDAMVGRVLDGKYRIDGVLGRGGMGVVYAGTHAMLGKRIAIKVLKGQFDEDPEILSRFTQEARAASAIGSAHIVDITDFGELEEGAAYFVMEYLEGEPLSSLIKRSGPVPPDKVVSIVEQICRALQAAHGHGIVHRDLKPDNVFLVKRDERDDFVKILDFGIAKVAGATGPRTRSGVVFGTPHYMAPEQAAGEKVDGRTDIYALGVILFELLAGKVPFDADSFMAILSKHMYQAPPALGSFHADPQRPAVLDEVVARAMSKKPDERQQSMDELRAALMAAVPRTSTGSLLVGSGPRPIDVATGPMRTSTSSVELPVQGRGTMIAALVGAALVAVGGVGFFAYKSMREPASAPVVATPLPAPAPSLPAPAPVPTPTSEVPAPVPVPPPPAVVRVRISSTPTANVFDGESPLGPTPLELDRPEAPRTLVLRATGREPETITLGPDGPTTIDVDLRPVRATRPAGGGGGARHHPPRGDGELRDPFGP